MPFHFNPQRIIAACVILGAIISEDLFCHATTTTASTTETASATSVAPFSSSSPDVPYLEAEFIFPRNETYKESAIFPVAFAFRGLDAVRKIGRFTIQWSIMPWTMGVTPGGIWHDRGYFDDIPEEGDAFIAVANTNVTEWLNTQAHRRWGDRYTMAWDLDFPDLREDDGRCGSSYYMSRRIMFTIHSLWQIRMGRGAGFGDEIGIDAVVPADKCPVFSAVVEFQPNATMPECPTFMEEWNTGRRGDPCGVRVDQAVASSIQSKAESMATSSWIAAHPESTTTSTSSNFAALATAPAGSAYVAVSLITYLTFGL
ncbi:hypothetical protein PG993_007918 [Apiospora rasikravindrae]|uniref:DUF7136 domain-containing protein n=1 Tax=Apiospora rasikravindrae TaxID=990691 RepID=A0ABR1SYV1_9PEZI